MNHEPPWDVNMMQLAKKLSERSLDRSTKVGCVIANSDGAIVAAGFNSFPECVNDEVPARHERPAKYKWTEHAERNAIYDAARRGVKLDLGHMYLPWYPCADCCRAIIQSGLCELVCFEPNLNDPKWSEDFQVTQQMLFEAGITVRYLKPEDC